MKILAPLFAALALTSGAPPASAQDTEPKLPTVELSAEGSVEAANDLAIAEAYFEATGSAPAALAAEVNQAIARAIAATKAYPMVTASSSGTHSSPVYNSNGRSIDAWRMRSSLQLETRDLSALSTLVGKLQGELAIASMSLSPAAETRSKAEDAALVRALNAFEARAKLAAGTLGKRYRIQRLNISQDGSRLPQPMYRAAMATAHAAPAPIEAGESSVMVRVSGSIELLD